MFHIIEVDKGHGALSVLVSELGAFQSRLYPAESNHCLDFFTVGHDRIRCVIAHDSTGFPAGGGAVFLQGGGFGEIKPYTFAPPTATGGWESNLSPVSKGLRQPISAINCGLKPVFTSRRP